MKIRRRGATEDGEVQRSEWKGERREEKKERKKWWVQENEVMRKGFSKQEKLCRVYRVSAFLVTCGPFLTMS